QFRIYLCGAWIRNHLGDGRFGDGIRRYLGTLLYSSLQSGWLGPRKIKAHSVAWCMTSVNVGKWGHEEPFQSRTLSVRVGSTAVHPLSCANRQQWVASCRS